ncbi:hypothetical protein CKY20_00480 [Capnocytophaga canis]|uniref:Lipocalin-like domain-containing protein n=2 Tax=Capnocytophaga canis TaxID=1848903 RepID=A0A3A1YM60_9FLAO|nr:hypothetical protein CKY20_00480 [Capnocytophaga canis]
MKHMKNYLKFSFFLLAVVIAVVGCKKDDSDNTGESGSSDYYVKAEVDGKKHEVTGATFCSYTVSAGKISVNGVKGNEFVFTLTAPAKEGVFKFGGEELALGGVTFGNDRFTSLADGTITIKKFDEKAKIVEGTFEFNAKSDDGSVTKKVTNGSFRCKSLL